MNAVLWLISIPLGSSPLIYLAGHLGTGQRHTAVNGRASWRVSLAIVAAMWAVLVWGALDLRKGTALTFTVQNLTLRMDGLSLLAATLALSVCSFVLLYSGTRFAHQAGAEKYYAMLLTTTGSIIGAVCARDLFNLWIWFEVMVIASFMLVSFYRQRPASLDASIKYLVQNAMGTILILLGIALVLGNTGTLAFEEMQGMTLSPALLAAGALFVIGFGIKCALVPLHTWLPDAYAEAPGPVSAMLSGAVTLTGVIALTRVLTPLAGAAQTWGTLLMAGGSVNILVGNLLALRQKEVKRLLAYSDICQTGYAILGLGIGIYTGRADAAQAGLFYLLAVSVMKPLAFLATDALAFQLGRAEGDDHLLTVGDLKGLLFRFPLPGFALLFSVLSVAGTPPLIGFIAKWQIFAAGFASQNPVIEILIGLAVLNIMLALGYYLPLMMTLCHTDRLEPPQPLRVLPVSMRLPLIVLTAAIFIFGIWPDSLRWLTQMASMAMMSAFTRGSGL